MMYKNIKALVSGYIKCININNSNYNIPNEIIIIIITYYWIKNTSIYCIGCNSWGQLGLGHAKDQYTLILQKHDNIKNIENIYIGQYHTIYSDYNNKNYWCTGDNYRGQCCLGDNSREQAEELTKITLFNKNNITIKNIYCNCGGDTTFWMDTINNTIYGNGRNDFSQLGFGFGLGFKYKYTKIKHLSNNISDIKSAQNYTICLNKKGEIYLCGNVGIQINKFTKIKELNNINIIKISSGRCHSLFMSSLNIIYCFGSNNHGQLGLGDENQYSKTILNKYFVENNIKIIDIKCGWHHNLCIDINAKVYSFGANTNGQCGDGLIENVLIPKQINTLQNKQIVKIKCGSSNSYAMSSLNDHYLWGHNEYNQCIVDTNKNAIKQPFLVNNILLKILNNKEIKDIFLGLWNTQILVNDK